MALQGDTTLRSSSLDAWESAAGPAPLMRIFAGAPPANCAAPDSGTKIAEGTLASDWMAPASGGTKIKAGVWTLTGVSPGGSIDPVKGHFRIYNAAGTTCFHQGTVGLSAADLNLDSATIGAGQTVTINTYTLTAGNQ